jgi:hypothetical protein
VTEDRQQLEAEIERTRERLGETVEALAGKADVKARAQHKAGDRLKTMANQAKQQITRRPVTVAVAAGAVGALAATLVIISRRRRR